MSMEQTCARARATSIKLASLSTEQKNHVLKLIANSIENNKAKIQEANDKDVALAKKQVEAGELAQVLLNRLILNDAKIDQLSAYLRGVAALEDPVGKRQYAMRLDDGLELERVSCPIGVVAVIFESRPEVVVQVSALSLKSGNAVILKGGTEAAHSNRVLFELIEETLSEFGLQGAVSLIETRDDVSALLKQDQYLDLIIPRGSNEFVRYIQENTKIPVLGHSAGVCHLYLAEDADLEMALDLALDSKADYPSACNAVETILLHESHQEELLPALIAEFTAHGITSRIEAGVLPEDIEAMFVSGLELATEEDWSTEYGDLEVSIKLVKDLNEAIEHINRYGSHHTDSIVTQDQAKAEDFLNRVDSACVFHNASTRFSDGYVFGLGAEVGISTNKTHSRGPVGLDGMVIYKYKLRGSGQKKGSYSGEGAKPFKHERMD